MRAKAIFDNRNPADVEKAESMGIELEANPVWLDYYFDIEELKGAWVNADGDINVTFSGYDVMTLKYDKETWRRIKARFGHKE